MIGALSSDVDALGLDNDRVGLMLDDVDADTSWTDFAWDRVKPSVSALTSLIAPGVTMRTSCILESMLALAREIGMRTLAHSQTPHGASVLGRYDFDYSPMSVDPEGRPGISGSLRTHPDWPMR